MKKSSKFSPSGSTASADCVTFASYRHTKYDLNGDAELSQTEFDSYNTDFGGSGELIKKTLSTSVGLGCSCERNGGSVSWVDMNILCAMCGFLPLNSLLMKYV